MAYEIVFYSVDALLAGLVSLPVNKSDEISISELSSLTTVVYRLIDTGSGYNSGQSFRTLVQN